MKLDSNLLIKQRSAGIVIPPLNIKSKKFYIKKNMLTRLLNMLQKMDQLSKT